MNYYEQETDLARKLFNLDKLIDFQLKHDVQIIRGADYQYLCYIDGKGFAPSLTSFGALVVGIKQYIKHNDEK